MNFDIKTEQLGDDAYVISLAGEVDLYTAPEFKQQLLDVIAQGGEERHRRLHEHDLHRLDHARRARRRREAAAHERRSALARLQRPQHHEDLRDHRPRPRVHDPRDAGRGGRVSSSRRSPPRSLARRVALLAVLRRSRWRVAAPAGSPTSRRPRRRGSEPAAALRPEVRRLPHARAAGHARDDRAEPRRRVLRPARAKASTRATIQEVVLGQIAYPDRADAGARLAADVPLEGLHRRRARGADAIATYVAAVAGNPQAIAQARQQGGGSRRRTRRRSSPRTAAAATRSPPRARAGTVGPNLDQISPPLAPHHGADPQRRRRDAGVQGSAHRAADRRGRRVRLRESTTVRA